MSEPSQKLSFIEKAGYSAGDAAANFVFMSMILFQANFYTDVFGLSAGLAGGILLVSRLWDAFFDPVMGVMADRTQTRWGRFRPWVLWTSVPWAVVMVLAYTTPNFSDPLKIAYAFVTNILLMTLYSANNMPYSALGGVMTGDVVERARLNSYRFVSVNAAQFIVGGFTVPLVAKFALGHMDVVLPGHDSLDKTSAPYLHALTVSRQYGWSMVMGIWAVLCLVCFLTTFLTTKERILPISKEKTPPRQDFADLFKNFPWKVMFCMTFVHFTILALRGGALYNYYMNYADKTALFNWLQGLGLTVPAGAPPPTGILNWLGYIVLPDKSNVAGVAYSIVNMIGTGVTIIVILLSPSLAKKFGKKAVAVVGFGLASHWHTCILFSLAHEYRRDDCRDCFCRCRLRSDHRVGLGHLRRRGGLFGMENRTARHGHGFRHDWFCTQIGPEPRLRSGSVDYGRLLQLRHQNGPHAGKLAGLPHSVKYICGRSLWGLHDLAGDLSDQQTPDHPDFRRTGATPRQSSSVVSVGRQRRSGIISPECQPRNTCRRT